MGRPADGAAGCDARTSMDAVAIREVRNAIRGEIRGRLFTFKVLVCALITAAGCWLALQPQLSLRLCGVLLIGLMFAHAAELQHETLHGLAYRSRRANRVVGVLLGLPMLISYTAYRVAHMRHHRDLGTPGNREFFDYGDQYGKGEGGSRIGTALTWFARFTMAYHYWQFGVGVGKALRGSRFDGESAVNTRRIRAEHLLAVSALVVGAVLSVVFASPAALWLWLLPMVVVAAPMHALIELPEHFRCETLDRSPFANTRTIKSNWLLTWYTNGNNFHVEHHLMPNLPIERLPDLHVEVRESLRHYHPGYFAYFRSFLGGK
ncbi:fatty acid desaturase [Streptomyces kanamyceticus]|uniref:Fatty acid desaturase n=1 Tax=Streptomyces kanamyceticus TaxID=1967 RepID=A0A5J6GM68_STRKN|nr:fatty acid desaturase [Streptomyces kanamyceticus]